jgi:hypothetical protein
MVWYGWLFLLAVLAVPAIICGVLYNDKSGSTPCIGCGECIRTGECVLVKNRKKTMSKKREKAEKPS